MSSIETSVGWCTVWIFHMLLELMAKVYHQTSPRRWLQSVYLVTKESEENAWIEAYWFEDRYVFNICHSAYCEQLIFQCKLLKFCSKKEKNFNNSKQTDLKYIYIHRRYKVPKTGVHFLEHSVNGHDKGLQIWERSNITQWLYKCIRQGVDIACKLSDEPWIFYEQKRKASFEL